MGLSISRGLSPLLCLLSVFSLCSSKSIMVQSLSSSQHRKPPDGNFNLRIISTRMISSRIFSVLEVFTCLEIKAWIGWSCRSMLGASFFVEVLNNIRKVAQDCEVFDEGCFYCRFLYVFRRSLNSSDNNLL